GGALRRCPADLVHLVVRRELSLDSVHPPVANGLRTPLAVAVARLADLLHELAAKAGFLLDLPQRTRFVGLAVVALALRAAPFVTLPPEARSPRPRRRARAPDGGRPQR